MAKVIKDVQVTVTMAVEVDDEMVGAELLERYITKAIDNGVESGFDDSMGVVITEGENFRINVTVTDRN